MRTPIALLLLGLADLPGFGQTAALTLVGPTTARPGTTISAALTLSNPPASLAGLQWSLTLPAGWTAIAVEGGASKAAAKTLYCNPASTTCLIVGVNNNVYAAGAVAVYSLTIPASQAPGQVTIPLSGLVGATLLGDAVPPTAGAAYGLSILRLCDINADGACNLQDLLLIIREILAGAADHDQNGDGAANVRDAQIVAWAAVSPSGGLRTVPALTADGRWVRGCFLPR